jgi:hypothetical protein
MWASRNIPPDKVLEVVKSAPEARYVTNNMYSYNDIHKDVYKAAYNEFRKEHGEKAVPISSNEELQKFKNTSYDAVMVDAQVKTLITEAADYEEPELEEEPTTRIKLMDWLLKVEDKLTREEVDEFHDLWNEL